MENNKEEQLNDKQLKEVRNRNAVEKYGSAEAINQKRSQTLKET